MLDDIVIVVVDDHDDIRFFLKQFLSRQGATVFACADATEGLNAVRAHHPNVVLSDISLPNRDGFELLRDIRTLGPERGGGVPVIAMTALGGFVDHSRTVDAGFEMRLDKPFGPDQLLEAVHSTLNHPA
jgi:DNA-binding response OmpR family regulator